MVSSQKFLTISQVLLLYLVIYYLYLYFYYLLVDILVNITSCDIKYHDLHISLNFSSLFLIIIYDFFFIY